jgi:protein-L-isoaspartate(D-aspartate) O-methyltransferase
MQTYANDRKRERFGELRRNMVEDQIRRRGINDVRVLTAMLEVPREMFVPQRLRDEAYEDCPLPIGVGQTISQPFTVAYMLQALQLDGSENVLEIGTGSGYGAAVLSQLAQVVHTMERIPKLGQQAKRRLDQLGFANVHVHVANGTLGLPEHAPFDAIIVTAGAEELPEPYREQVAEDGRIVIPIGEPTCQVLSRFTRHGQQLMGENLGAFAFVPLIGEYSWSQRRKATEGDPYTVHDDRSHH